MSHNGNGFVKGILTGVIAGAAIGIVAESMMSPRASNAMHKNVNRAVKNMGSAIYDFTSRKMH